MAKRDVLIGDDGNDGSMKTDIYLTVYRDKTGTR